MIKNAANAVAKEKSKRNIRKVKNQMIIKGDFSNKYTINELLNKKNICDGLILMKNISDEVISTAFFDPQYRGT